MPDIFFGFLGLFVGSFLNVCIYRLPRGESIAFPPSHCTECGTRIKPGDLVPILSYLAIRGRCRECNSRISARYPAVELLTGAVFYAVAVNSMNEVMFLKNLIFLSALVVVFFIDLDHEIIPDVITLPLTALGLAIAAAPLALAHMGRAGLLPAAQPAPLDALEAALIGFCGFLLIGFLGSLAFRKEAMGGGDVKLAAMLGAFLGMRQMLIGLFLAFLAGATVGPIISLARGRKIREPMPFGPMMVAGAAIALFYSEPLLRWYVSKLNEIWG